MPRADMQYVCAYIDDETNAMVEQFLKDHPGLSKSKAIAMIIRNYLDPAKSSPQSELHLKLNKIIYMLEGQASA